MPRICQDTYRIHEVSVSCTNQGRYPHSHANVIDPYPRNTTIIDWLDGEGMGYLDNPMNDLYNEDFLWGTAIQTTRLQNKRQDLQPKRDRVLDRLITLGVWNVDERYEPGMSTRGRSVPTSLEMHHVSSIGSQLLSRIDVLEKEVGESIKHVCNVDLTSPQVTREHAEHKEMEEAFKRQASKVDEILQQNQELGACLVDLEKLWLAEEQFTMELCGCVEALQVCLFPGGIIPLLITNVSRTRSASVDFLGVGKFPSRYIQCYLQPHQGNL